MKCSWQTFLSPLKGQCPQYALIGLSQTTRLTGGFDFGENRCRWDAVYFTLTILRLQKTACGVNHGRLVAMFNCMIANITIEQIKLLNPE